MPSPPHNPRRSLISSRLTMRAESLGARERATVLFPENDVPHSRTSLVPDAMSASNSLADTGATRNQNAGATRAGRSRGRWVAGQPRWWALAGPRRDRLVGRAAGRAGPPRDLLAGLDQLAVSDPLPLDT